jgi:hypothetical protein
LLPRGWHRFAAIRLSNEPVKFDIERSPTLNTAEIDVRLIGVLLLAIGVLLVSSLLIDRTSNEEFGFFQRLRDLRIRHGE